MNGTIGEWLLVVHVPLACSYTLKAGDNEHRGSLATAW